MAHNETQEGLKLSVPEARREALASATVRSRVPPAQGSDFRSLLALRRAAVARRARCAARDFAEALARLWAREEYVNAIAGMKPVGSGG